MYKSHNTAGYELGCMKNTSHISMLDVFLMYQTMFVLKTGEAPYSINQPANKSTTNISPKRPYDHSCIVYSLFKLCLWVYKMKKQTRCHRM